MEGKNSILLVDDNTSLNKTLSYVLKRKGYAVTTTSSGQEALEIVKENHFDIIFLDIKMPVMNGVETYKQIKKINPGIKVTMMTAYAVEELVQEALEEGAHGIIYKPLDIDEVVALIDLSRVDARGAYILVVDDDPSTTATLKKILDKKGYGVKTAHSGEEAINISREKTSDIIFVDMKLPVMNGLETYLKIRKIDPGITGIMMTAYKQEMDELVQEALHNSAYTCLYKPFDIPKLLFFVQEILKKKHESGRRKENEGQ